MAKAPHVQVSNWDPLCTFQFRVRLLPGEPSAYIAGVRSISGLSWSMTAHETWSGGNDYHRYATPDRITWEPLTLEQGIALDDTLEEWANAARDLHKGGGTGPVKRTMVIDLYDRVGAGANPKESSDTGIVRTYTVRNAWVSKFVALPKLDSMASEVAFLSVEIVHEGWQAGTP